MSNFERKKVLTKNGGIRRDTAFGRGFGVSVLVLATGRVAKIGIDDLCETSSCLGQA